MNPQVHYHDLNATRFLTCVGVSQQMMAKFAEDDRIEQMNAQKRRMKQLEHKKAVEQLLKDRQEQFARERVRRPQLQLLFTAAAVRVLLCNLRDYIMVTSSYRRLKRNL